MIRGSVNQVHSNANFLCSKLQDHLVCERKLIKLTEEIEEFTIIIRDFTILQLYIKLDIKSKRIWKAIKYESTISI